MFTKKQAKNFILFYNYKILDQARKYFLSKIPTITIEPDEKWKILWDFFIIFLYLILFFIMAIQISFDNLLLDVLLHEKIILQKCIQFLLTFFLGFDIILKCVTAYYQNGILITVPSKILSNYIGSHFIYDFLAIIPIFFQSHLVFEPELFQMSKAWHTAERLSQFLIYFKSFEVIKALERLDDMLQLEERSQAFFNLIKLVIEILLFSHIIACVWHGVASYSPYHENMLEVEDLIHKNWFNRYLTFLFWTICPEKLEPKNELEYGFGFFAVLASHAVFGFIIEGIHSILESLSEKNVEMKKDIRIINKYFDKKNINYDLQMKIRKYFYFMNEHHVENSKKEFEVINKLSTSLREELLIKANGDILNSVPLFSLNFSPQTMKELILSLKKKRYYPEETIFKVLKISFKLFKINKQGENHNNSMFFIGDGEINLCLDSESKLKKSIILKRLSV